MAAIDFPNNPEINDEYSVGVRTWIWTGTVWKSKTADFTSLISEANAYTDLLAEEVDDHIEATTNVHGIEDTSLLATQTDLESKYDIVEGVSSTEIGYLSGVESGIQAQIDGKAASVHGHVISDVTDLQTALDGKAASIHNHEIGDVTSLQTALDGKAASIHDHAIADVTGLQTALDGKAASSHDHAIADVTGLQTALDGKAASIHSHGISDVTGLQTALDGKAATTHSHVITDVANLETTLGNKSNVGHTHAISDISGVTVSTSEINFLSGASSNIQTQINGKAASTHSHSISDVTNLQTELNGKAASVHTHNLSDISDVSATATEVNYLSGVTSGIQNQINGKADLSGATFTGFVTLHADPTQAMHAATKEYVDNVATGIISKPSVYAATTANLDATYDNGTNGLGSTLTANSNGAFPVVDGVQLTLANGFRGILVKNQTNPAHNGRYNLTTLGDSNTPWVLTKCSLCATADQVPGSYIFVTAGLVNGGTGWVLFVNDPATFVVGTDPVFAFQFSGSGTVTAGSNIEVSGSQVSLSSSPTIANLTVSTSLVVNSGVSVSGLSLNNLSATNVTSPASGDVLFFDGTNWVNRYVNQIPAKSSSPSISNDTYTLTASDAGLIVEISNADPTTVIIPDTETFPVGTQIVIIQSGVGSVSVDVADPGQTINYSPSNTLRDQWSVATILKRGTDNWLLYGDLA